MRVFNVVLLMFAAIPAVGAEPPATAPAVLDHQRAVSIRDPYLRGLGADNVWSAARSVGITRLEVYLDDKLACPELYEKDGTPYRIDSPDARVALREKATREGFSIGCLTFIPKLEADGSADESMLRQVRTVADAAPELGHPMVMLPIAINDPKDGLLTDEAFVARGKAFVRELDRIAAKTGVQIVIENLGKYWNRPEILEPVLRESTPDRVGLLMDITNMYWYGFPLDRIYELARQFAPFVRYMHIKNVRYPADQRNKQRPPGWEYGKYAEPVRTGDIEFARILDIVAKTGYVGDLTIEDDSLRHFDANGKKKVLADDVDYLRHLIQRTR